MSAIISTAGLGRRYGNTWALRDLSLSVEGGSVYGLLGANGAGKTTTLRLLATLLAPSAGQAWVAGEEVSAHPGRVRRQVGYMPDSFGVYDDLTVVEYLDFYATAHGVRRRGRRQLLEDLLSIVGLEARRDSFVDALSRGMKQRLGIARCLVHDPPLLLLDEPASGLDPLARREMQVLVKGLVELGKTVLISSHILPELSELCSHVGLVDGGRLLLQGSVSVLLADLAARAWLEVELREGADLAAAAALLAEQPAVRAVEEREGTATLRLDVSVGAEADLFQWLGAQALPVVRFGRKPVTLEELYFGAVQAGSEAEA